MYRNVIIAIPVANVDVTFDHNIDMYKESTNLLA